VALASPRGLRKVLPDEELADVRQLDRLRASFDKRSDLIEDVRAAVAGQLGDEAGRGHARDHALAVVGGCGDPQTQLTI
jgi:hypothetical protein